MIGLRQTSNFSAGVVKGLLDMAVFASVSVAVSFAIPAVAQTKPGTATSAPAAPAAAPASAAQQIDTESIISTTNAFDRTRPFPVADKRAYFTNIKDGDVVKTTFRVSFAVTGMGVSPVSAGKIAGTGHHHILIDMPFPADIKAPIPFDKPDEFQHQHYKHFGKGETEAVLTLPPGKHTLQLLFADEQHIPYYIRSNQITINVVK